MHFTNIFASLALAVAVSAECFNGGPDNINKNTALNALPNICTSMSGTFVSKQQKELCVTDTNLGYHWHFTLKLTSGNDRKIDQAECLDGMRKEVNNCKKGGKTGYGNWEYKADPNHGICMDTGYINNPTKRNGGAVISRDIKLWDPTILTGVSTDSE